MMPGWQMEFYERLRAEIVKSAVDDLRKAIRKSKRLGYACDEQIKLEKWFLSKWGQLLSGDNGEYIIEKCHETYKIGTHGNGKSLVPDDVQRQICADYRNRVKRKDILKKYGISEHQFYRILRRCGS